jgi:hypothetical protein
MSEGVVLGHHISSTGIEFEQTKVNIIKLFPRPQKQNDVRSLQGPKGDTAFHIHIDASENELWEVLGQQEDTIFFEIYFINKNLFGVEMNYIVTKKEFLALVYAINKFGHYVTRYPFFLHTLNHVSIR